ncbi:hypothetical protein [Thalassotalea fusca]
MPIKSIILITKIALLSSISIGNSSLAKSNSVEILPENQWLAETLVDPNEHWLLAEPRRYDTLEQFFLTNNCKLVFVRAYIYDTDKQHWLSYDEAVKSFPEMAKILTTQSCDIKITNDELSELLQLDLPKKKGPIMLYFDVSHSNDGTWVIFNEDQKTRFLAMRRLASTFNDMPRYLVRTPRIGFKAQQF